MVVPTLSPYPSIVPLGVPYCDVPVTDRFDHCGCGLVYDHFGALDLSSPDIELLRRFWLSEYIN